MFFKDKEEQTRQLLAEGEVSADPYPKGCSEILWPTGQSSLCPTVSHQRGVCRTGDRVQGSTQREDTVPRSFLSCPAPRRGLFSKAVKPGRSDSHRQPAQWERGCDSKLKMSPLTSSGPTVPLLWLLPEHSASLGRSQAGCWTYCGRIAVNTQCWRLSISTDKKIKLVAALSLERKIPTDKPHSYA